MFDYAGFIASHRVVLAPLAGVSDAAFRTLCLEHGAELTFTEMVSSKALSFADSRTVRMIDTAPCEERVGVQLFGHDPSTMAEQAAWVEEQLGGKLAVIDINMGCPARKIVAKGDGCALMKDMELAQKISSRVVSAVKAPVSVKMRRAFDEGPDTAPELAKRMEQAGVAAVCVHGRTATQLYRGAADWESIARVKRSVSVPVIGNGDIRCGADAVAMIERTGCDSVMVARGAQGNPWIFREAVAALAQAGLVPAGRAPSDARACAPTAADRIAAARRQTALLHERDPHSVVRMRKHACWYVKGLPGAAAARAKLNACTRADEFYKVFDELEAHLESRRTRIGAPGDDRFENGPANAPDGGEAD